MYSENKNDIKNKKILADNLKYFMDKNGKGRNEVCKDLGIAYTTFTDWCNGKKYPRIDKIQLMANYFNINKSDLIEPTLLRNFPAVSEDNITFPIIGEIAAGYDHIAVEDWSGETVEIPRSYLHGRQPEEFMVLSVHGDSMYPAYQEGDKVLILKQSTLNRSGEVGAVIYDGDKATLKKVEYVSGEEWLKLIPLNPSYPPQTIAGADLEECRIIGIPKLLIRDIIQ